MAADPIKQFAIKEIVPLQISGIDISFTNSALAMTIVCISILLLTILGTKNSKLIPSRLQATLEMLYEFIENLIVSVASKEALKFFPLIFSMFMFIAFANILGLIPFNFTITSHLIVTLSFALLVFVTVIVSGFINNGVKFLKIFVPSGVSPILLPIIVFIEFASFISRPISLSIRLFANMLAGHITLKVFAGFIVMLLNAGALIIFSPLPLLGIVILTAFELLVACLQAYVFTILTCVYLNDALNVGH